MEIRYLVDWDCSFIYIEKGALIIYFTHYKATDFVWSQLLN